MAFAFISEQNRLAQPNLNYVWDANSMSWVKMTQPGGGPGGGDASAANQVLEIAALGAPADASSAGGDGSIIAVLKWIGNQLTLGTLNVSTGAGVEVATEATLTALNNNVQNQIVGITDAGRSDIADVTDITPTSASIGLVVRQVPFELSIASAQQECVANSASAVLAPTSGKKLRVHYLAYNPADACNVFYSFGASSTKILWNSVPASSVIAKDFGDTRYIQGGVDDELKITASVDTNVFWNCFYTEV